MGRNGVNLGRSRFSVLLFAVLLEALGSPGDAAKSPRERAFPLAVVVTGTKTVAGSFVPGGAVTYTVTLMNSGMFSQRDNPGDEFTDVLPASLTLVSATAGSGTAVATTGTNTVTWNGEIPTLGLWVTITINATINAGVCGTIVRNQGKISFDFNDDGVNEATALTNDPSTTAASDPTAFIVPGACPNVVEVPTLSESGLIAFAILLAGAALLGMRRRHTA